MDDEGEYSAPKNTPLIVYFSSVSGNTRRFVEKLNVRSKPLPLKTGDDTIVVHEPYVLCAPTYGNPKKEGGHVPPQVVKFLNVETNRKHLLGVIGAGNTNFSDKFCIAADIIAQKCEVPVLYKFELMGTPEDVVKVNQGMEEFWKQHNHQH